jgi:hypothetical protein
LEKLGFNPVGRTECRANFFIGNPQTTPSSEARTGDGFEQEKSEGT